MATDLVELERRTVRLNRQIRSLGRPLTAEEERHVHEETQQIRQGIADEMVDRMIVNRPELVSRGQPVSGQAAQRGQQEARTRLHKTRGFKEVCSDCPAATVSRRVDGAVVVHCRVEGTTLTSAADPQSLLTFCMGSPLSCPSWQAEKEAIAAGRRDVLAA